MADLCQQCSIEIYGEDSRDLAGINDPNIASKYCAGGHVVICEGCGWTIVDNNGRCLLHDHEIIEAQIHAVTEV